ncbi:MAG: hypothetical protein HC878_04195 [Leptolyngbyaceae cyanobacterium SL_5_14]|nr:hypothetical protein [Leptolyngbyaceae cyanobacterium SL_5_14]
MGANQIKLDAFFKGQGSYAALIQMFVILKARELEQADIVIGFACDRQLRQNLAYQCTELKPVS